MPTIPRRLDRFLSLFQKFLPVVVALVIGAFCIEGAHDLHASLGGDATQNFLSSYNLYSHFQYGHDLGVAGYRREPFPNWILALFFFIFTRPEQGLTEEQILSNQHILDGAVHVNLVWSFSLFISLWILSRRLFKSPLLSDFIALVSIVISNLVFVRFELNNLNTELPAAVLLVILAAYSIDALVKKSPVSVILTGCFYGLLVLTKASGAYVAFITIPLLSFALSIKTKNLLVKQYQQALRFFLCLGIGFSLIVAPWVVRNSLEFNKPLIAEGGGRVLWIRSEFDQITPLQYAGAFYAYSPRLLRESLWEPFLGFKSSQLECGGDLQLHNRGEQCDIDLMNAGKYDQVVSLYERGKKALPLKFEKLAQKNGLSFNVDEAGKREFLSTLQRKPLQHFALTLPLAWRGLWSFVVSDWAGHILNFCVMGNLIFMPAVALALRSNALFILSLTPAAYFWFYAFVSQFWERFSEPFIPIAIVIFAYTIVYCVQGNKKRSRKGDYLLKI